MQIQSLIQEIEALSDLPENAPREDRIARHEYCLQTIDKVTEALDSSAEDDDILCELAHLAKQKFVLAFADNASWQDKQQAYDFYNAAYTILEARTLTLIDEVISGDTPNLQSFNEIATHLSFMSDTNHQAGVCTDSYEIERTGSVPIDGYNYKKFNEQRPFEQNEFLTRNGFSPDTFANQKIRATMVAIQAKIDEMREAGKTSNDIRWKLMDQRGTFLTPLIQAGVTITLNGLSAERELPEDLQTFDVIF